MRGLAGPRLPFAAALALLLTAVSAAPLSAQQPGPARWWDDVDRVDRELRKGRWKRGARALERLRREVLLTSWRAPDLGQVLSELAFLAAVGHANRGEGGEAVWEWQVAQAFERVAGPARGGPRLAERDLAPYGPAAELLPAHPLRDRGKPPAGEEATDAAPFTDFEPAAPPDYEPAEISSAAFGRERLPPALFEVYVDREGRARQPVIVSPWTPPVILQWGFDTLRRMPPFTPARLGGEPVGVLHEIELTLGPPRRI